MSTVVFTGAGISTESGIPDFRSPGGVWERFDPQEFHITRFHADPAGFWRRRASLINAMDYLGARPNAAHLAIAEAARDGRIQAVVTQNVDGLHAMAGTPPERLIEIHGNGRRTVCLDCGLREDVTDTVARIEGGAPRCPACGGLLKPDVVLFGEPVHRMMDAAQAVQSADHLIVAGTSLQVYPAAGLVDVAAAVGAKITICNRDATAYDELATVIRGPLTETLPCLLAAPQ